MDAEGDELLPGAEDLDARDRHLRERLLRAVEEQALRPEADPHQRVAGSGPHQFVDLMRDVGVEHIDVDADQRAGPQADAMVGILMCPAGDRGLIDQNLGPAGQRRPLRAGHDRQRFVTVVEEAERRGAVACPSADGATAGRLWVFQVRWRGCVPRRHRGAVLGPPQVWALEGDHTPDAAGHTAARLGQGVAAAGRSLALKPLSDHEVSLAACGRRALDGEVGEAAGSQATLDEVNEALITSASGKTGNRKQVLALTRGAYRTDLDVRREEALVILDEGARFGVPDPPAQLECRERSGGSSLGHNLGHEVRLVGIPVARHAVLPRIEDYKKPRLTKDFAWLRCRSAG